MNTQDCESSSLAVGDVDERGRVISRRWRTLAVTAVIASTVLGAACAPAPKTTVSAEAVSAPAHAAHHGTGASAAASLAPEPGGVPRVMAATPAGWGTFAVACAPTSLDNDDPIRFPNEPGASHEHQFYAATDVDAFSDATTLLTGATSCDVLADRSAYWHPTLRLGERVVTPTMVVMYYRRAPATAMPITPPAGLELLGGRSEGTVGYTCGRTDPVYDAPPARCPTSAPLRINIAFPECTDGTLVWDDGAHVAFRSADGTCPAATPLALPMIEMVIRTGLSGSLDGLRLSYADIDDVHADVMFAWVDRSLAQLINQCLAPMRNCEKLAEP